MEGLTTQGRLLKVGKEEFLEKGYKDASLRGIAKKAGCTLGAFYGYYGSKEALFDDIVKEAGKCLMDYYTGKQTAFWGFPLECHALWVCGGHWPRYGQGKSNAIYFTAPHVLFCGLA